MSSERIIPATPLDPRASAALIRKRLLRLLASALLLTLASVTVILTLVGLAAGIAFHDGVPPFPKQISELRDYYKTNGTWAGVQPLFDTRFRNWVLIGTDGVVYARGQNYTGAVGEPLQRTDSLELRVPLRIDDTIAGEMVTFGGIGSFNELLIDVLGQVGFVLFLLFLILAFFAGLVAYQLARRYVDPLADVIAAAQAVAGGRLSARAPVRGPGDLRVLNDSFNHMADALERSDRERRDLLADVAHELRTPLSIVQGRLEGMVDGIYALTPESIAPALEETYLLERLVEDLRTLTLAEAGTLEFDTRPVQIAEVARRVVGVFQAAANERQIELHLTGPHSPPLIEADPQRLEQVIGNLVDNGLRYTPAGGRVQIAMSSLDGHVRVAVADTGPGVAEKDIDQIFDRFWRGDKSRSRSAGGAGLGLAIVRQLVEAQRGTVRASLRDGGGLVITLEFPKTKS